MKIGFIGLGVMGNGMATNIIKAGFELRVFDVMPANLERMGAAGAIVCANNAEVAANSDLVITMLPNAKIVETVYTGEGGIFPAAKAGTIMMDMSTVSSASCKQFAGTAEKYGLRFVGAPVSGGVAGAAKGTLTIMVGCAEELFNEIRPVLDAMGKNIFLVGDVGMGNAMKIVNNLLLGANMANLAEALVLGKKCGLSVQTMHDIIKVSSGESYALDTRLASRIMADNYEDGFAVDVQLKDLNIALETGHNEAVALPMTSAAVQLYQAARAQGLNRQDIGAIIKVWERLNGVEVSGHKD